jgi:glycosyltransferase involved in cell wall biosynthesis
MKISVCIPTYNQGAYVEQTVRSILNQTLLPDEIVISNDCSTDETSRILAQLQHEISIIKVVNQSVNLGISKNTDACLRLASGNFIVRVDSDDLLLPDYIEVLSTLLVQHPEAGYAHCAIQEIDSVGNPKQLRQLYRKNIYESADEALLGGTKGYKVAANILMFRRSALEKVNYIASKINFAEDYYLAVSLANAGYGNVYSKEVLACYRVWSDTGKVRARRKLDEIKGLNAVFREVLMPAFKKRGFPLALLSKAKENIVNQHADCLAWNVYTEEEKVAIEKELRAVSNTALNKLIIYIYKNKLAFILNATKKLELFIRSRLKKWILN